MTEPPPPPHDAFAALRYRDFRLLAAGKLVGVLGEQAAGVAVGWELYERTGSTLSLGLVGLAQVAPVFLFALPAGHLADRASRRAIVAIAQGALAAAALALAALSRRSGPLPLYYACLFAIGAARAFRDPAASALVPSAVPPAAFANAATWGSASWHLAVVLGPATGGAALGLAGRAWVVHGLNAATALGHLACATALRPPARPPGPRAAASPRELAAGVAFIWKTKVILAAVTLDALAVLLGGATALLPVFAKDVLHLGPAGLGWLRAAPSIGAVAVAAALARRPPLERAGPALLWSVAGFGAATVAFGLSRSFPLSLLALAALGGLDQVSVVIRGTLLLVRTPDALRGRVGAVHDAFVGASNELGEFEAGVAAHLLGPVLAVAAGGVGTLLVVLAVAALWPEVRRLGRLHGAPP